MGEGWERQGDKKEWTWSPPRWPLQFKSHQSTAQDESLPKISMGGKRKKDRGKQQGTWSLTWWPMWSQLKCKEWGKINSREFKEKGTNLSKDKETKISKEKGPNLSTNVESLAMNCCMEFLNLKPQHQKQPNSKEFVQDLKQREPCKKRGNYWKSQTEANPKQRELEKQREIKK